MFSPVKILLNPKLKKTTNFLITLAFILEKLILAFSCLSFFQSVHLSACISSAPTGRILAKFGTGVIILKSDQKIKLG